MSGTDSSSSPPSPPSPPSRPSPPASGRNLGPRSDWGTSPTDGDDLAVLPRRPNAWAMQELDPTLENRVDDVMRLIHERTGEARLGGRDRVDTLRPPPPGIDADATVEMLGPPAAMLEALTDDQANHRPSDGSMLRAAPSVIPRSAPPPALVNVAGHEKERPLAARMAENPVESTMAFRRRATSQRSRSPRSAALVILLAVVVGLIAGIVVLGALSFLLPVGWGRALVGARSHSPARAASLVERRSGEITLSPLAREDAVTVAKAKGRHR
jgi:hypothetical protein